MKVTSHAGLREVMRHTKNLLLDFDGPICGIFAGRPASLIASEIRERIRDHDDSVPEHLLEEDDPLHLLGVTPLLGSVALMQEIDEVLRKAEIDAASTAEGTPHVLDVLEAAREKGLSLGIVSNNSVEAVMTYLQRRGLASNFVTVVGRYKGMDPRLLKPSSHLVVRAMMKMSAPHWSTTLVGDSATDIAAARSANIRGVGYANKPGKRDRLAVAGADAVVESMADLARAIAPTPAV
jgi:HAD superfamily hydrolase (TIGR01549 family)